MDIESPLPWVTKLLASDAHVLDACTALHNLDAAGVLLAVHEGVVPPLLKLLKDSWLEDVRLAAVWALGSVADAAPLEFTLPETISPLVEMLYSSSSGVNQCLVARILNGIARATAKELGGGSASSLLENLVMLSSTEVGKIVCDRELARLEQLRQGVLSDSGEAGRVAVLQTVDFLAHWQEQVVLPSLL